MALDLAAIPLAGLAGVLGIVSPCVWPLVPVIVGSIDGAGRVAPCMMAFGLALAFAVSGTVLSLLLVSLGIDPELFRYLAACILLAVAVPLLHDRAADWLALRLSRVAAMVPASAAATVGPLGSFGMGALLGLVWLPCVGPTLGAAIALASMGQQLGHAFAVMLAFGFGTAAALLAAALLSARAMQRWRRGLLDGSRRGKQGLGVLLVGLGALVLTGWDKQLEGAVLPFVPDWVTAL